MGINKMISQKEIKQLFRHFIKDANWHELDRNKLDLGYGWIHYGLIRLIKPKRVLVVGSRYGFIPAVCALGCRDNKIGVVDFVDAGYDQTTKNELGGIIKKLISGYRLIKLNLGVKKKISRLINWLINKKIIKSYQPDQNHWGGVGFWKRVNVNKHFNRLKVDQQVNFYLMTSKEFKKRYPKRTWDYVYLDGDHSYQGIKKDFNRFWPNLNKNGYLSIHDIRVKKIGKIEYGMVQFWQELKKKNYQLIELPGIFGLGVIKK